MQKTPASGGKRRGALVLRKNTPSGCILIDGKYFIGACERSDVHYDKHLHAIADQINTGAITKKEEAAALLAELSAAHGSHAVV